jgi:hypothetical protein
MMKRITDEEISNHLQQFWFESTQCPQCHNVTQGFYALSKTERDREVAEAQLQADREWLQSEEVKEKIAEHYMIQCQNSKDFECPYLETCPHEDKDICQWQLDQVTQIISLLIGEK